jgi:hypothetical protein
LHKILAQSQSLRHFVDMLANRVILEAIATKHCLKAGYNGTTFILAPHILYTRRDLVYLDAVPLTKNGAPPREEKMATFKVDGMSDIELAEEAFEPSMLFEPWQDKYRDTTLFSVPE